MPRRDLVLRSAFCVAVFLIAACAAASPTSTLSSAHGITLAKVDGGPRYYARFSHGLPTRASYFPIGVWFESIVSRADIHKDKKAGLNLYVALVKNSVTEGPLASLRPNGMRAILQDDWTGYAPARRNPAVVGWELADEIDMQQANGQGAAAARAKLNQILSGLPHDGRARYSNYGKGVGFWNSDSDAAAYVNNFQQLQSADLYWFTDENICSGTEGGTLLAGGSGLSPTQCHRAANYGATVRRLRSLVRPPRSKPVWAFVELGHPFTQTSWPTIKPAEVRAAVWQSLIAGARGIIYFNHSFGGPNQSQHILREGADDNSGYAAIRSVVGATNRRVKQLAPVLNSPTVRSGWSQGAGTTARVKWAKGHFYVFAGSAGSSVNGRFSLPCVGDASAALVGERRTIPVRDGSFTDHFADANAIHIYRINGGSTCGLHSKAPRRRR